MKIRLLCLPLVLGSLAACTSKTEPAPAPGAPSNAAPAASKAMPASTAKSTGDEAALEGIPTQDEMDAEASKKITKENQDKVFEELKKKIESGSN